MATTVRWPCIEPPARQRSCALSEVFFIKRAVSPFSEIFRQPIAKLTAAECSVIVLPDGEKLETGDQANLDAWIRRGGIVLRFAGPQLAASKDDNFTPVSLRRSGGLSAARCCGANRQNSRLFPNRARFTESKFQKMSPSRDRYWRSRRWI